MAGKDPSLTRKLFATGSAVTVSVIARRTLIAVVHKATGKRPPANPETPGTGWREVGLTPERQTSSAAPARPCSPRASNTTRAPRAPYDRAPDATARPSHDDDLARSIKHERPTPFVPRDIGSSYPTASCLLMEDDPVAVSLDETPGFMGDVSVTTIGFCLNMAPSSKRQ
jgi:hypothetical protein